MPIRVQNDLPIKEVLEQENIFVMDEYRAAHQEIRDAILEKLNAAPGVSAKPTEGGSYLFVSIPELDVSLHQFIRILRELANVTVTPGNVVDYDFVKADILRITADYNLKSTAYDRWNASQTIIDLQNEGMEFSPFGQGFGSMSAPTKQLEALVLTGEVEHFGNPVLRWMLTSTVVQTDPAGNIKPDKRKSPYRRSTASSPRSWHWVNG